MTTDSELLSVADAAKALNRSTEQVRRYLREGRLAGRRLGGQWFIETAALATFQDQARRRPGGRNRVPTGGGSDPLGAIIGIGGGGGSNIADGKDGYRRAFWWRR